MRGTLDALALLCASGATGVATWRIAALTGAAGAHRLLSAVVLAASSIVIQSLVLGLVGLGSAPAVLVGTALVFAVVVIVSVRPVGRSGMEDLQSWWIGSRSSVAAVAATSGVAVAAVAWAWWKPFVGFDGMLQNLVQINGWVQNGHPGSQRAVLTLAPVEAFPMTNDVILGWFASLGGSFAATTLWSVGSALVFVLAFAALLADAGVPARTRWLAVGAVASVPHFVGQLNSPKSDVAALAWLVAAAALAHVVDRHPRLLVVVFLAGGLSVGSKTTTLPLVGLLLLVVLWRARPRVPTAVVGVAGATAVGGVWYLRNLVDHGSPLWPFATTPWGDPVAAIYAVSGSRFVADPVETVRGQFGDWTSVAAGGLVLVTMVLVVAALFGTRRIRLVVAVAGSSLALWMVSPVTGLDNAVLADDVLTSTTRYLLPTMVLGALAWALLAVDRPGWAPVCDATLVLVVVADLVALRAESTDVVPHPIVVLAAAAVAAAVGWTAAAWQLRREWVLGVLAACALAASVGLAVAADGWTERHRASLALGGRAIDDMLKSDVYRDGEHPVLATNLVWSDLAGDALAHDVVLLRSDVDCERYRVLHRTSWLVFPTGTFVGVADLPLERGCLADVEPFASEPGLSVFAPADR